MDDSGTYPWTYGWQAGVPWWPSQFVVQQQLDPNLGPPTIEDFMGDATADEYTTRWSHALDVLPFSERVVSAVSLRRSLPTNSCENQQHEEWRTTFNLFEPDMTPVSGVPQFTNTGACSWDSSYPSVNGTGQENPDVSASWLFGDFFVVTWYDRPRGCKIYARVFNQNGSPVTGEIVVDDDVYPTCDGDNHPAKVSSPRVAAFATGFAVVWTRADGSLWLRTYDTFGTPFINRFALFPSSRTKFAPEVEGTAAAPCPEDDFAPYFAVTWWERAPQGGGVDHMNPRAVILQDLSNPFPVWGFWGYLPLDTETRLLAGDYEDPWDRISADFFDASCNDLTLGLSWSKDDRVSQTFHDVRRRVYRFVPECSQSQQAAGLESTTAQPNAMMGDVSAGGEVLLPPGQGPGCNEGSCFTYTPTPHAEDEPDMIWPPPERE
ncbi:MAG: hypothetical protein ACQEXJ_09510 [Myxococcota bacterium]